MAIYNLNGNELQSAYSMTGTSLEAAYNVNGQEIFSGGSGGDDYDHYDTEYQHQILLARDAWKTKYRADNTVVPLLFDTDQHGQYRYSYDLFTYLGLAIKWNEISAHVNLGDTCGATYTERQLNEMVTCLTPVPSTKQINVWGNHDIYITTGEGDGSQYAYHAIDNNAFTALINSYFDNSDFGTNVKYDNRQNQYLIDENHGIKYVVMTTWYYDQYGDVYYNPQMSGNAVEAWITMLSAVDNYDIVLLMHIQPYYYTQWYHPPVDGGEWTLKEFNTDQNNKVAPRTQVNQLLADRKLKRSGSIVDFDGVTHNYNFANCTSDILCGFAGHEHEDYYQYDANGTVPIIMLDAMGYDNHPFFMVNVDRTRQLVDIWKVDDSPTYYNYQVPFTKHPVNPVTGISLSPSSLTIAVGESYTLTPTITHQYSTGQYPKNIPSWTVRVNGGISSAVASCTNGVVTGKSAGQCVVYAHCEGFTASCNVTVTGT